MRIINRVSKILRSEITGGQNAVYDSIVRPSNFIAVEYKIIDTPKMEAFGVLFKTEIVYSIDCKYNFAMQDTLFFDSNGKLPDDEYFLGFCKDAAIKITSALFEELSKNKMIFDLDGGKSIATFAKKDLLALIQEELHPYRLL